MRVILIFLVTLAAAVCGEYVEIQRYYHHTVGIPEAARIKAAEKKYLDSLGAQDVDEPVPETRIVGGVIAPENAHQYLAGLIISLVGFEGNSVCGSTLVSPTRLISAAHCWFDGFYQAWQYEVVMGTELLFLGGTRVNTREVVVHSDFNPQTLNNDVAMIYLPINILFNHRIQPVSLPLNAEETFVGTWAVATGYGRTSDQHPITTEAQISHVNLQVISVADCAAIFGSAVVQPSTICTSGTGGVGICGGDLGGPLVVYQDGRNVLVGVGSFVSGNGCEVGHPSGFTRTTSFLSWITSHL